MAGPIFTQWKLGDFGLATTSEKKDVFFTEHNQAENFNPEYSMGVGTFTYASPEQLSDKLDVTYTTQSDIYSLGIIFFELLYPFKTGMERARVLSDLRQGVLPEDFVQTFPKEATLILWLTSLDPDQRPTASQLVEFEHLRMGKSKSSSLFVATEVPDTESQNERIAQLESENEQLKARVKELEELLERAELNSNN